MLVLILISFLLLLTCESGFILCNGMLLISSSSWQIFMASLKNTMSFLSFLNTTALNIKELLG
ncbi:unnamed protein product [Schistosoma rodhaini]|uniref:Uncharacterized protein n=1 Tax=Schistosoma rodhaini TaxID=6188 RepID=A0AA85G9B4_9TREM|nr:unnamed protein product [Schistosoma rodhaini]